MENQSLESDSSGESSQIEGVDKARRIRKKRRIVTKEDPSRGEVHSSEGLYIFIGVGVILILNVLYFGFSFLRFNFESSKAEVFSKVSSFLGGDVQEFSGFDTGVNKFVIRNIDFSSPENGIIASSLRGGSGDLSLLGFLKGEYQGSTMTADWFNANVSWPITKQESSKDASLEFPFDYSTYVCERVNLNFISQDEKIGDIKGSSIIIRPTSARFTKGDLTLFPFTNASIDNARFALKGNRFGDLIKLDLGSSLSNATATVQESAKTIDFKSYSLSDFLQSDRAGFDLLFDTQDPLPLRMTSKGFAFKGEISPKVVDFSKLSFLKVIDSKIKDINFRNLLLESEGSPQIQVNKEHLQFSNLKFSDQENLVVKGSFQISNDKKKSLSGEVWVGVLAARVCDEFGNPKVSGFSKAFEGFSYAKVELSGTARTPKDDFLKTIGNSWR